MMAETSGAASFRTAFSAARFDLLLPGTARLTPASYLIDKRG